MNCGSRPQIDHPKENRISVQQVPLAPNPMGDVKQKSFDLKTNFQKLDCIWLFFLISDVALRCRSRILLRQTAQSSVALALVRSNL